ncbi:hypothetical protein QM201_15385 [Enterobacter asburiae]|nr:hypothetical protein [Enterobacter asburiae]
MAAFGALLLGSASSQRLPLRLAVVRAVAGRRTGLAFGRKIHVERVSSSG